MARDTTSAARVTEIVSLLRPPRSRKLPESLAGAAASGDLAGMQLWIDRGAGTEQKSLGATTALIAACAHNQIEAARWLIAHGAALDPPGVPFSPVDTALGKGYCAMAAVLLDAGLPIERAAWGVVAAATLGRADMLRWLLGRGIDLDATYPRLGVLRAHALRQVKAGAPPEIAAMLSGEADPGPAPTDPPPDPPRPGPPRAAPEACAGLTDEAVRLIGAGGAAAGAWNAVGPASPPVRQSLLAFAAASGAIAIVTALLDAGASPNIAPDGTPPPLTAAAGEAELDVVRLLLARGARPDGRDGRSWLPLASAAQSGDREVVRVLLEAGANPRAKPAGGPKLVDYARGPYAAEIRAMLEQAPTTKPKTRR